MCKNEYRRNKVRGSKDYQYDLETIISPTGLQAIEGKYDRSAFMDALSFQLEKLSEKQSETFNLRYMELFSLQENMLDFVMLP